MASFFAILGALTAIAFPTYSLAAPVRGLPVPEGFTFPTALGAGLLLGGLFLTVSGKLNPEILKAIIDKVPSISIGGGGP